MKIIKQLILLLGFGVVGAVIIVMAVSFFQDEPTAMEKRSDDFMNALKAGNYRAAYEMLSDDLKNQIGSVEDFQTSLARNGVDPKSWSWSSNTISGVDGEVTMKDGTKTSVSLVYAGFGGSGGDVSWRLIEYRFSRR